MASAITCGLILLGNSGVGKSFLANRLLDDDQAFESRFSVGSVTRHTEWKNMSTSIGKHTFSVANIPGLVEANQKLIDENRTEIMKAFEQCPFAIVLFVFGHKNGRIPDEDLVAFMRINDAFEFPAKSLLLIINGIPSNRPDGYEERTAQLLQELTHADKSHIYFIEKTTSDQSKKNTHNLLYEAVAKCEPTYHEKKHDIELVAEEISRLKMESKHRQDQLLTQENEYSQKQQLYLVPNSTVELHRPSSQQLPTVTMKPKSDTIDHNKQFDEMMEAMEVEHNRNMEELKRAQQNPNRNAIEQLTDQMKKENDLNTELLDQISSSPQVIVISKERQENIFQTVEKGFHKVVDTASGLFFGESPSRQSKHRKTSRRDSNGNSFQSSARRSSNSHHQSPTNN